VAAGEADVPGDRHAHAAVPLGPYARIYLVKIMLCTQLPRTKVLNSNIFSKFQNFI